MSDHAQSDLEDDLDWEEWDGKGSFLNHCVAGSIAGIAEHTLMYPFDTVKTHMQCSSCPGQPACPKSVPIQPPGIVQTFRSLATSKGGVSPLRMWRGVHTMFMGCVPAHALYFSSFEVGKKAFGADREGHHFMAAGAAGAISTFFHDSIMAPADTIKQRLQLGYYHGVRDCVKQMLKNEGPFSLYRSFPTTLAMNVPYGFIMVASNESLKKVINPTGEFNLFTSMVSGCGAGAVAASLTTPLDVVKTKLQTQNLGDIRTPPSGSAPTANAPHPNPIVHTPSSSAKNLKIQAAPLRPLHTSPPLFHPNAPPSPCPPTSSSPTYTNGYAAFRAILKEDGFIGLFKGMSPRLITHAPAVAISWTTYEGVKSLISEKGF
ncbi:hypothetical protein TrST_g3257 [Triparma strigata]|uniref:Uncharacterized protein n=1 Tax=Triparma strigata TaxID=1606541 RepID=A0A9W7BQY2_9STRA|nr:hypothetical protein TrST_g3257 [Triparma strigata]